MRGKSRRAVSSAATACSTECCRPSRASASGSRLCTPSETRFTPAARNAANRPASTLVGLASSVISMSGSGSNAALASAIRAATVSGSIRLGVPPPKKIEPSCRRPSRAASQASSARSAARKRACGIASRTWELKSQYGHFARQNGQWM